jgi:transcriptional regulator
MYIPRDYRIADNRLIFDFIRKNGFAQLITMHEGKPLATHLPLVLETGEKNILHGHLARGNPQWRSFEDQVALAVFTGPHSYISSSWYDHVNVPTWNYIAIHIYGKIRIINDDELYDSLKVLVDKYEAKSDHPVRTEDMKDYVLSQMKGVVGFQMSVDVIEGKWKMSQNRDDKNYAQIIAELKKLDETNAHAVAAVMEQMRPQGNKE